MEIVQRVAFEKEDFEKVSGNGVFATSAPLDRLLRRVIQSVTATFLNSSEALPLPK